MSSENSMGQPKAGLETKGGMVEGSRQGYLANLQNDLRGSHCGSPSSVLEGLPATPEVAAKLQGLTSSVPVGQGRSNLRRVAWAIAEPAAGSSDFVVLQDCIEEPARCQMIPGSESLANAAYFPVPSDKPHRVPFESGDLVELFEGPALQPLSPPGDSVDERNPLPGQVCSTAEIQLGLGSCTPSQDPTFGSGPASNLGNEGAEEACRDETCAEVLPLAPNTTSPVGGCVETSSDYELGLLPISPGPQHRPLPDRLPMEEQPCSTKRTALDPSITASLPYPLLACSPTQHLFSSGQNQRTFAVPMQTRAEPRSSLLSRSAPSLEGSSESIRSLQRLSLDGRHAFNMEVERKLVNYKCTPDSSRRVSFPLTPRDKEQLGVKGSVWVSQGNSRRRSLGSLTAAMCSDALASLDLQKGSSSECDDMTPPPQLFLPERRFTKAVTPKRDVDSIWEEQEKVSPLWAPPADSVPEKKEHKKSRLGWSGMSGPEEWVKTSFWSWSSGKSRSSGNKEKVAAPVPKSKAQRLRPSTSDHPRFAAGSSSERRSNLLVESEAAIGHYKRLIYGAPFIKICSTGGRKARYVWCSESLDTIYWAKTKTSKVSRASSMSLATMTRVMRGRDISQANRDLLVTLVGERYLDLEIPAGGNGGYNRDQWAEAFRWLLLKRSSGTCHLAAGNSTTTSNSRVYPLNGASPFDARALKK